MAHDSETTRSASSAFLRRALAFPGLAAFWGLLVPLCAGLASCHVADSIAGRFGVAVQDGTALPPEDVGRALLYGLLLAIAGVGSAARALRGRVRIDGAFVIGALAFAPAGGLVLWDEQWDFATFQAAFLAASLWAAGIVAIAVPFVWLGRATRWARHAAAERQHWAVLLGPVGSIVAVGLFALLAYATVLGSSSDQREVDVFIWSTPGLTGAVGDAVSFLTDEARKTSRAEGQAERADPEGAWAGIELMNVAYADLPPAGLDRCLETLTKRAPGKAEGHVDLAAGHFRHRAGSSFDDAMDLAAKVALRVCERPEMSAQRRQPDEIRAYFWGAVEHQGIDERLPATRPPGTLEAKSCLAVVFQRLESHEQALLHLCIENTVREIEARTGRSKSEAQRECRRIILRVQSMISTHCR